MYPIPLATTSTIVSVDAFWEALLIYHDRPHLVNRKITAISPKGFYKLTFSKPIKWQDLFTRHAILYQMRLKVDGDFLRHLIEPYDEQVLIEHSHMDELTTSETGLFASLRVLLPRPKHCPKGVEVVVFERDKNKATFIAVSDGPGHVAPPFAYDIELANQNLRINVGSFDDADTSHAQWLVDKVFYKLVKWIENDHQVKTVLSLSLVEVDKYCLTYDRLKQKYGEELVKKWPSKTGTDPQKYVYEDIAIASYLICLWNGDKVNFVDCGCGNGLLVYLLTSEGFEGLGVDVRRRPTWDLYPDTQLLVSTINPDTTFHQASWIIGNHSDELTPWIPVIALKSNCNFFLLPCCPFDFNGRKFIRRNTGQSGYSDYMDYVREVSEKCGFSTEMDKLRIPSTKRTCLVGRKPTEFPANIDEFLQSKTANLTQRSDKEQVRNCTQLDRTLIANIVQTCMSTLLHEQNLIGAWNQGSVKSISDLVQAIAKDQLQKLKQECGGLQTLLRNHRYLFDVQGGMVKIRLPVKKQDTDKYKNKPCWFLAHHPDGCLWTEDECGYRHGK